MRWTRVLCEYCSYLSVKNRLHFEEYIYYLHRLYQEHLNALYDTVRLFPRHRTYSFYLKKSRIYTPPFCLILNNIRDECIEITDIFFDIFNKYLIEDHKKRKVERNSKRKINTTYQLKVMNFSLRYVPKELRLLICNFLVKKKYTRIAYCIIYDKKKCPRKFKL